MHVVVQLSPSVLLSPSMVFDHLLSEHELYIPLHHSRFAEICQGNRGFVYNSFTDKGKNEKNDSAEEQLRENQYLIQDMDPVADITYNVVNKQRARLDARDIFREAGYKVDRQGFGIIEIGENQLSDSTRYLNNPAEFAAWMCVPKVLKRGRVISGHKNHKNRGYPSITIAAPVVINGKRGDVAVVVQQKGKNKYYVHRILMPDGSRFEYENTKNAESTGDSIVGKKTNKRLSIDSASNDSITQPEDSVNRKNSLSEENSSDTAYLSAVERGDMETAIRETSPLRDEREHGVGTGVLDRPKKGKDHKKATPRERGVACFIRLVIRSHGLGGRLPAR